MVVLNRVFHVLLGLYERERERERESLRFLFIGMGNNSQYTTPSSTKPTRTLYNFLEGVYLITLKTLIKIQTNSWGEREREREREIERERGRERD